MIPYGPEHRLAAGYFCRLSAFPREAQGLLEFLFWLFSQGHTAYPPALLPQAWTEMKDALDDREKDTWETPRWDLLDTEHRLFGDPPSSTPFVLVEGLLTLRVLFKKEEQLAQKLLELKYASLSGFESTPTVPRFQALEGLQRRGVEMALGQGIFLLSGGPGTGKTFTLAHILLQYVLKDPGIPITLLAPTGRAADRIRSSISQELSRQEYQGWKPELTSRLTNLRPRTIHSLLAEKPAAPLRGVIVVDEASMADLHQLCALTAALEVGKAHLILSGDKDQLPSVENGAILSDLTRHRESLSLPAVILTKCFRSGDALVEVSRGLVGFETRELSFEDLKSSFVPGKLEWKSLPSPDHPGGARTIKEILAAEGKILSGILPTPGECRLKHIPPGPLESGEEVRLRDHFSRLDSMIFLCNTRSGLLGTQYVNTLMAQILGTGSFGPGTPVLITRNHREWEIYNGDRGLVYEAPDRSRWVLISRPEGLKILPFRILRSFLEEAWAITIHKSQGSEYRDVKVLLGTGAGSLLTREILYTGITRARRSAVILAPEEVLKTAASRRVQRSTGLPEALNRVSEKLLLPSLSGS